MSSGSYSAICVNGCQTWDRSQMANCCRDGITILSEFQVQAAGWIPVLTWNPELGPEIWFSPLHNDLFVQPHAEHNLRAVGDNREFQKADGPTNGQGREWWL